MLSSDVLYSSNIQYKQFGFIVIFFIVLSIWIYIIFFNRITYQTSTGKYLNHLPFIYIILILGSFIPLRRIQQSLSLFLKFIYCFFLSSLVATTVVDDYSGKEHQECDDKGSDRNFDPILCLFTIVIADEADYNRGNKHDNGL